MAIANCITRVSPQGRELVTHGTALLPAACYDDDLRNGPVEWHWHDELEAVLVVEGEAVFAADREQITLHAGEGCLFNSGVLHAVWSAGDGVSRLHSVVFHPRLVGGTAESIFWEKYLHPALENRAFRMRRLSPVDANGARMLRGIAEAWQACETEALGFEFELRRALSELVLALWSDLETVKLPRRRGRAHSEEMIKRMLTFVREHFSEELTVERIAASAAVSESECIRCFRKTLSVTPIRYVRQLRLQTAAGLLAATDERIADIGGACGFQEMSYFARSFREQFGETPSEYRKKRRGKI